MFNPSNVLLRPSQLGKSGVDVSFPLVRVSHATSDPKTYFSHYRYKDKKTYIVHPPYTFIDYHEKTAIQIEGIQIGDWFSCEYPLQNRSIFGDRKGRHPSFEVRKDSQKEMKKEMIS